MSSYQHGWVGSLALLIVTLGSWTCGWAQTTQSQTSDDRTETPVSGRISGRVVNESGQPLSNAVVYARSFGSAAGQSVTTTDGQGNFQVVGLDPMAYQVWAALPSYTAAPRDPDSNQAAHYRVGDSVRLELLRGGVITGTVTNSAGDPIVAVSVFAYMIRDAKDQPPRYGIPFRERLTDDRGVYRVYGLAAGTYIVSAGGSGNFSDFNVAEYESHSATYAPSATRDNAGEVRVRAGEEISGVDIRYRGEPGHVVSGFANDPNAGKGYDGFNIRLTMILNGVSQWSRFSYQPPGKQGFAISGIADGDYDVTAERYFPGGHMAVSEPRRIKVRGADVTRIELTTKPLGSISGRVALEGSKVPECSGKRRPLISETLVSPWHNQKNAGKDKPQFLWSLGIPTTPDNQGDFKLRNLAPGQYRISTRFFAKYWYLRSISLPSSLALGASTAPANRPTDAARNWIPIKSGQSISGLTITLAEGAASLHGKIKVDANQKLPARLFVYLIPAEQEKGQDVLRFFATLVSPDGSFALNNLAPGRYRAIAKSAHENESEILSKLRLPDEEGARTKLHQEAGKIEIELKPCQNVTGYLLPLLVP